MSGEERGTERMGWPAAAFWIVIVLTVAVCYLGRIEALPWQ